MDISYRDTVSTTTRWQHKHTQMSGFGTWTVFPLLLHVSVGTESTISEGQCAILGSRTFY